MYGPQTAPLVETMPLADYGWKPAARSAATRIWMDAAAAREARVAALRAPDFYGPGVGQSYLGDTSIGKLARGKPGVFVGSPDVLHDYAYVPDIARAATTLLAAPDSAFGRAWHIPHAPTRTTRDILRIAAEALGVKLRISAMPAWMLGASAMFSPFLGELTEMRFQWDRPYRVDASRFANAFWSDATPFETGVRETALAFRAALKRKRRGARGVCGLRATQAFQSLGRLFPQRPRRGAVFTNGHYRLCMLYVCYSTRRQKECHPIGLRRCRRRPASTALL